MDIVEKIHKQRCSFVSKNCRAPDCLYLGLEEYEQLIVATSFYGRYDRRLLARNGVVFKGLEVIVVDRKNHLNFGFKD